MKWSVSDTEDTKEQVCPSKQEQSYKISFITELPFIGPVENLFFWAHCST